MNDCRGEQFDAQTQGDVFDQDIEDCIDTFERTHDGKWLLEAIRRTGQYGKPLQWRLLTPFNEALEKYRSGEARTLDEAFGVSRPKSWSQSAARARAKKTATGMSLAGAIWHEVYRLHDQGRGMPIDQALFEEVIKMYGMSWSTARNYYRECEAMRKQGD